MSTRSRATTSSTAARARDTIYADDVAVIAPVFTGLATLDKALEDLRGAIFNVITGLHFLSLDFELLAQLTGTATTPHDIRIGNDTILGGDGDDYIVGDNALISVPFAIGAPVLAPDFTTAALRYHSFLSDLEYVATDFLHTVREAHITVLHDLVAKGLAQNPNRVKALLPKAIDPDYHHLFIGDDIIDAGAGNDVVIGDQGGLLSPVVTGVSLAQTPVALGITPQMLRDTNSALAAQDKLRAAELSYHLATNVANLAALRPSATELKLVPKVFEYDLSIGNDTIRGGGGNDLLIGDDGVVILPLLTDPALPTKKAVAEISILLNDLQLRLSAKKYVGKYDLAASKIGHFATSKMVTLRSALDTIFGEQGNDVLIAGDAAITLPFATYMPNAQVPLTLGFSHVSTSVAFLDSAVLKSGRALERGKDQLFDVTGANRLLKQTGNLNRKDIATIRSLIFDALPPQTREFFLDAGATQGRFGAGGGDVSVLPPGGSITRIPTLNVAIAATPLSSTRFTFSVVLDGLALPSRFGAVWQIFDATGKVVASGTGTGTDIRHEQSRHIPC